MLLFAVLPFTPKLIELSSRCRLTETQSSFFTSVATIIHQQVSTLLPALSQRVCFTGELLATLNGSPIRREIAEALASEAGLIVTSGVSKKLDILVVADPNTQSGKAKKAREYGIRILSEPVFWQMLGVSVD